MIWYRTVNWCTKAWRRKTEGTGRRRYTKRCLKRLKNRERFNRLPELIRGAILDAKASTGKRVPPKRAYRKAYRKRKLAMIAEKSKNADFIHECLTEVNKRVAAAGGT